MADHVLYRFYSATGQLLYVGITMNPSIRFKSHQGTKSWWSEVAGISIENYESRDDLANAERRAIQVERPMHNVVHKKGKRKMEPTEPTAPPSSPSTTDDQFGGLFASLFGPARSHTCYGYVTDEEYERRAAIDRAKAAARDECTLCDASGYRGRVVCDHVDRSGAGERIRRTIRKSRLQVVDSGGA